MRVKDGILRSTPKSQYKLYLAESNHARCGKLEPLAVLKTNPDGAGIVQTIGPLKMLASENTATPVTSFQRFLDDPSPIVAAPIAQFEPCEVTRNLQV